MVEFDGNKTFSEALVAGFVHLACNWIEDGGAMLKDCQREGRVRGYTDSEEAFRRLIEHPHSPVF